MDRKSDLKIKEILFATFVLFIMIGFVFCHVNKKISENQIYELTTIHPELENEIQNTFDYYDNQRQEMILGVILCTGILCTIFFVTERIYKNKRTREQGIAEQNNLQELQECIEAFQKEDYTTKQNMFSENVPFANNWIEIQDTIQRLGRYLSDLRDQLHQEENSTKTLITDISHQLKTPLASLKMCFELTQETTLNEMEKAEFIEKEKQEIAKLESLLGELVKLSRLENNMIQVNPTDLSIKDLITEGAICIMNMINTMIHNVHLRKKEIGMMQAIGMSDGQLTKFLQVEGLFYTLGTLVITIGVGSVLGYPVFLWAKNTGAFNIREYHYPTAAALVVAVILFLIQMTLAFVLSRSVKKESLIERVRYSE